MQKLEEEALLAEQNRRYYEAMENQHFEIRRLKHDMTNHLQTALALPDDQREGYLRELLEQTGASRTLKYCGDTTVNIILSAKAALMEQNHIDFHVSADISEPLPMEKTDISAVFGNALDNALEAVKKLPESQRRVSLEARQGKGILAVSVRNQGDFRIQRRRRDGSRIQESGSFFQVQQNVTQKITGWVFPAFRLR